MHKEVKLNSQYGYEGNHKHANTRTDILIDETNTQKKLDNLLEGHLLKAYSSTTDGKPRFLASHVTDPKLLTNMHGQKRLME